MKSQTTKKLFACLSGGMLYLIVFFLQGCQKETSINDIVNVKANLANTLVQTKIIYHDVLPDITLVSNGYSGQKTYNLDLNGDKITDFSINGYYYHYYYNVSKWVSVSVLNKNGLASDTTFPLEMNLNDTIASNLHWITNTTVGLRSVRFPPNSGVWSGNWTDTTDHYLGLKINSGGSNYYGWARLDVSLSTYASFTVKDYAYNSIPNQPILAGQTK